MHVPKFPCTVLVHRESLRMYILQCMRHNCYGCRKADSPALPSVYIHLSNYTKTEKYAVCSKRVILFKCRGQYIAGGKLLNRRNTLDNKEE